MKSEVRKLVYDTKVEVEEESGLRKIVGFIPYNTPSRKEFYKVYGYNEVIAPTAFNKTLADGSNVFAYVDHNSNKVLASTDTGTMKLSTNEKSLQVEVFLGDTPEDDYVYDRIKRGIADKMSFKFYEYKFTSQYDKYGIETRILTEIKPVEISLCVPEAVYSEAISEVRSLIDTENFDKLVQENNIAEIKNIIGALEKFLPQQESKVADSTEAAPKDTSAEEAAIGFLQSVKEGLKNI